MAISDAISAAYFNEFGPPCSQHSLLSTLIMDAAAEKPEEDINAYVPQIC
jgi:hypothetical protein